MTTKTTFPLIGTEHGETIRRNAETGVEIRGTRMDNGKSEYTVYAPGRDKMRLINYYETLAGAREEASDRAQEIRDLRDAAYSDAITENAERAIAEHCQFPSVAAMIEKAPAGSAHGPADLRGMTMGPGHDELLAANPTEGYDKAEAIRDSIPAAARTGEVLTEIGRSMTSLRPADALRHAEKARDLVAARAAVLSPDEDANTKRVMFGLLATATGFPYITRVWFARHDLTPGTPGFTIEALYAAHEADHAEALRRNR